MSTADIMSDGHSGLLAQSWSGIYSDVLGVWEGPDNSELQVGSRRVGSKQQQASNEYTALFCILIYG